MRVVITGGAGFLGRLLAAKILERGALTDASGKLREVSELVLVDMAAAQGEAWIADKRVSQVIGDVADRNVLGEALAANTGSVFHLAAVVSGQAEADFDIGMRVNVDATRTLLELTRTLPTPPKFVFTSSIAVFGGLLPAVLPDDQIASAVRATMKLHEGQSASIFPDAMDLHNNEIGIRIGLSSQSWE